MPFPRTVIQKKIAEVMEPIGSLAARFLEQAMTGPVVQGVFVGVRHRLSADEEQKLVELAARIEIRATILAATLMAEPQFLRDLMVEALPEHARRMALDRSKARTDPFRQVLSELGPGASLKAVVREMERCEKLLDRGDTFAIKGTDKTIRKSSLPSKLSRLRKELRSK